jgi:RNA polymerase sigma-70 factor (ECF subfamily)
MASTRPAPPIALVRSAGSADAWRRGDRAALEELFRTHAVALERLLGRLLGASRADVEDALQTTFVEAIRSIASYRGEAPIGSWLSRIAVRVALAELDRPHKKKRADLELVGAGPDGDSPEHVASTRADVRRVLRHMSALGAKNRVAFILHVVEGHPIEDVAALVGASVTATKSRVFLARRALLSRVSKDPALAHFVREGGPR